MRKIKLVTGEKYHVFNRGVDKRIIFLDEEDKERFFQCMKIFNNVKPVGSLYEYNFRENKEEIVPLVHFVAGSLLINHFHFLIEQAVDNGVSEFMKKLSGGYTWYFNNKYNRSGSLFQGTFKSSHIESNEYLLYASVYINLNDEQGSTEFGGLAAKNKYCSWTEYIRETNSNFYTHKYLVLNQFINKKEYEVFALSTLEEIKANKKRYSLLEDKY